MPVWGSSVLLIVSSLLPGALGSRGGYAHALDVGNETWRAPFQHAFAPLSDGVAEGLSTGLAAYYTMNYLVGMADQVKTWVGVSQFNFGRNMMRNMDTLRDLHDKLVEKIQLTPAAYNSEICLGCSDAALDEKYVIKADFKVERMLKALQGNSSDPQEERCPLRLKKIVATMRQSLAFQQEQCEKLFEDIRDSGRPRSGVHYETHEDRGCDGDCEGIGCDSDDEVMAAQQKIGEQLHDDLEAGAKLRRVAETQSCVEVDPHESQESAIKVCQAQCEKMEGCRGITFYNGEFADYIQFDMFSMEDTLEDGDAVDVWRPSPSSTWGFGVRRGRWLGKETCGEEDFLVVDLQTKCPTGEVKRVGVRCRSSRKSLGCTTETLIYLQHKLSKRKQITNRCCFRASVLNEYRQGATACHKLLPHDELYASDAAGAAAWLRKHVPERTDALHGVASKIEEKQITGAALESMGRIMLENKLELNEASALRLLCMLEAQRFGTEDKVNDCGTDDFFDAYKKVQRRVDPFVFFAVQATKDPWYIASVGSRIAEIIRKRLEMYKIETQWIAGLRRGAATIDSIVYYEYTRSAILTVYRATTLGQLDYVALGAAVTELIAKSVDFLANQCQAIETWVRRTPIAKTIEEA